MAKKTKIDYLPLFEKYENKELTATQISKEYGINRTSFLDCYKRHKARIMPEINDTAYHLNKGLDALKNASDNIHQKEQEAESLTGLQKDKALRELQANKNALQSSLEILEKNHGVLAQAAVAIVSKGMKKANELLNEPLTAREFESVMSGFKSGVDSVGLFPKSPLVAIQNNLNATAEKDKISKPFDIKVNFLETKKDKKNDDIINAEVVDVSS